VRAGWRGSAAHGDVVIECRPRRGHRLVLGNTNAAHCATRTRDAERRAHRLLESNALEDGVDAEAVGELVHALNRLAASLADDVCCAELSRDCAPVGMPAHD